MEINKQLFEDVLSGKLKGTFVLRDGTKIPSCKLESNSEILYFLAGNIVYCDGRYSRYTETFLDIVDFIIDEIDPEMYSYNEKDIQFIKHFIKGYNMKENELTIEIPEGKIVDWEASQKQNKIIFKEDEKPLTYKDICIKLSDRNSGHFYIDGFGDIEHSYTNPGLINTAPSKHQLECILAKNKLATVAKYLNDGWKPYITNRGHFDAWVIYTTPEADYMGIIKINNCTQNSNVLFKTKELAEKAIEILGEETVKLALEPLGV